MFLKKILEAPELRAEIAVEGFLKLDDKVAFEKFKAGYVKNQKIPAFKTVKNSKGNLTLKFDPKANNFLFKTQKHFTQIQPSIKEYILRHVGCTRNIKALPLPFKHVDKPYEEFRKNVKRSMKWRNPSGNKTKFLIAPITSSQCLARQWLDLRICFLIQRTDH